MSISQRRSETIIAQVSKPVAQKLLKLKEREGFGDKDYGEWLSNKTLDIHLEDSPAEMIQKGTRDGLLELWLQNLAHNLPVIWKSDSIAALVPDASKELDSKGLDGSLPLDNKTAIVIGRGPSLFKNKHLEMLAASDYAGTVICSDGILKEALAAGVTPDRYEGYYVASVDGHPDKIAAWYQDPIVVKHGRGIKAVLCSFVSPSVVAACKKAKITPYFFHPIFDDWRQIESYTKVEQFMTKSEKHPNGIPAMVAGGNVGSMAWILSWLILRRNNICLIGLTMGYLTTDDLTKTYYWDRMMETASNNVGLVQAHYTKVHNPVNNTDTIVDPVFAHYRDSFLEMLEVAPSWLTTYNCSAESSLFSTSDIHRIKTYDFASFLEEHRT